MQEGSHRLVAIANGSYSKLPALTRAEPDAVALAGVLHNRYQFEPRVLKSLPRGVLLDQIDDHLAEGTLNDGVLIVAWIGHGKVGVDNTLRLLGRSTGGDVEVASAGNLGE